MKIYPCGTQVKMKVGNIEGTITCIQIIYDIVKYEITYCVEGEYRIAWRYEPEFEFIKEKKIDIGFKNNL